VSARPLRRGSWSVQELQRLRQLFPKHGVRPTAELMRRSPDSVQRKVAMLFATAARQGPWTPGEDLQLRLSWGALDPRQIGQILGRQLKDVVRRAAELRGRLHSSPWTRAELALLKELYGTRSDEDLELSLLRPREDVAATALRLCLAKDKRFRKRARPAAPVRMPRWTETEMARLREIYPDRDNLEVARMLGRTVTSVANKASQIGLRKSPLLLARLGRANVGVRWAGDGRRIAAGLV
jgi:hypothetical protein